MGRFVLLGVLATTVLMTFERAYSAQSGFTIRGVVVDSTTAEPLAGAQVSASFIGVSKSTTADSQGRFAIDLPEPGRYRVVTSLEAFVLSPPAGAKALHEPVLWVHLSATHRVEELQVRLVHSGVITGRVLDINGQPLPGKSVSVQLLRYIYNDFGE